MTFLVKLVLVVLIVLSVGWSFMYIDEPVTEFLLEKGGVQDVYQTEAPIQFILATFSVVCCFWVALYFFKKKKLDPEFRCEFGIVTVVLTVFWTIGRLSSLDYTVFVMFIGMLAKVITVFIMIGAGCAVVSLVFYEGTKKPKKTWVQPEITPEAIANLYKTKHKEVID